MTTVNLRKVSLLNKIRSVVGRIMQYAELPVHLGVKFIGFLILYRFINNAEMFAAVEQTGLFHKDSVLMVLALAAALLPNRGGVFIGIALVVWNVFQLSLMGAILVGLVLLLLYVVAAGLFPDHVYLLVLVPAAIRLNWLLAVPLAAGMYMGAVAIIPAAVGVIMYGFFNIIPLFLGLQMDGSLDGIPKLIDEAARSGLDTIMSNESLAYLMIVFAGVIVVTSLVRGLHVNFSRYIALGAGSILGLVTLLGGVSSGNVSSDSLVLHSVLTILVMLFLELLSVPLSYKSAQLLEFEDDDYLYKVKMIPKMTNTNMLPGGETRMTGVNARAAGRKLRDLLPGKKGQASEAELQQETSPA
ncbi:MAG: hypothetical protein HUJ69_07850, partial [Lachnospiraceae bacterium]|nr:hypothetical protein [Lachnospiraceae bacterium]